MYDYTDDQLFALEMVEEHGRPVDIQLLAGPSTTAPWKNAAQPVADTTSLPAVFVPPSSAAQLGIRSVSDDLLKRTSQILIVAPGAGAVADLSRYDQVRDGGVTWNVLWSEMLKPGEKIVLYYFGVRR